MGVLMNLARGDGSTTVFNLPNNAYTGEVVLVGDGVTTQVVIETQTPYTTFIYKVTNGTPTALVLTTDYTLTAVTASAQILTLNVAPAFGVLIYGSSEPILYKADWQGTGLLYKTQRTNLLTYGDAMTGAGWSFATGGTGVGGGVATGSQIGPDGNTSAVRLQMTIAAGTTAGDFVQYWHSALVLDGVSTYTDSFWIKSNTASSYTIQWTDPANNTKLLIVTPTWTRVQGAAVGNASSRIRWFLQGNAAVDKTVDILVAKVQTELGSAATPFIPTPGAASVSVTDYALSGNGTVITMASAPLGNTAPAGADQLLWDGWTYDRN